MTRVSNLFNQIAPPATPQRYALEKTAKIAKVAATILLVSAAAWILGKYVCVPIGSYFDSRHNSHLLSPAQREITQGVAGMAIFVMGTAVVSVVAIIAMAVVGMPIRNDYQNWKQEQQKRIS